MFHRLMVWTHSLAFRILAFNLLGLLITFLGFFFFLNRFQQKLLGDRMDADLEREVLMVTSELEEPTRPLTAEEWSPELERYCRASGIRRSFFRFISQAGWTAHSDLSFWEAIETHPVPKEALAKHPWFWETAKWPEKTARVIYYQFPEGDILQIGRDLAENKEALSYSREIMLTGSLVALVVCALLMFFLTHRGLKGIATVSMAVEVIREKGTLGFRVPDRTGTRETDILAQAFNQMMGRIQHLMENLRMVMDNIAHDLRTPVARMRGLAEAELRREPTDLAGHVIEECDILLNLTNTLLEIAAAESGLYPWRKGPLDLAELVRDGCDLFAPVFEDTQLSLELEAPDTLMVHTDGRVLQRVVANLVDNAIKYSEPGGTVHVQLAATPMEVVLTVRDEGIGIGADEVELIFDRFYRTDHSRSRKGNGLGLAFCKAALEGLGGEIRCESTLHQGSAFFVRLPWVHLMPEGNT